MANKIMKKRFALFYPLLMIGVGIICLLLISAIILTFNNVNRTTVQEYDHEWIIGRTKDEIEERYGEFDLYDNYPFISDEILKSGYYIVSDCYAGWFGEEPGIRYCIHFNENEIAVYCELEYFGEYEEWWNLEPIEVYQ